MRILLVGNYPLDEQESMQRYAAMLAEGLSGAGCEAVLLTPAPVFGRWGRGRWGRRVASRLPPLRKWLGYLDKFVVFPFRLRAAARQADLVHICDHSNAVYLPLLRGRPNVITCHDLLGIRSALGHFPENPVGWTGRMLQRAIAAALRRAQRIVCVSQKTRNDVRDVLGVSSERLRVIENALHWPYSPAPLRERVPALCKMGISPDRAYFLHVGANHWYKNRSAVLPIFAALRRQERYAQSILVLAGQPCPPEFRAWLTARELEGSVISVNSPSNAQLRMLYSGAAALIFPSREEGFGWPILEAQACGCPVAVPNRAPMNAVAGEGAILIDPADPAGAARTIARALESASALTEAGFRNVRRFDRRRMLEDWMEIYGEITSASTLEYAHAHRGE